MVNLGISRGPEGAACGTSTPGGGPGVRAHDKYMHCIPKYFRTTTAAASTSTASVGNGYHMVSASRCLAARCQC
eukprot:6244406-Pyramimonas_sp.AAC.1